MHTIINTTLPQNISYKREREGNNFSPKETNI